MAGVAAACTDAMIAPKIYFSVHAHDVTAVDALCELICGSAFEAGDISVT